MRIPLRIALVSCDVVTERPALKPLRNEAVEDLRIGSDGSDEDVFFHSQPSLFRRRPTAQSFDYFVTGESSRNTIEVLRERGRPRIEGRHDRPRPSRWRSPDVYDVFEPNRTYLGAVRLPMRSNWAAANGDRVWVITRDELGVQRVVRYRIEPIGGVRVQ